LATDTGYTTQFQERPKFLEKDWSPVELFELFFLTKM
jgi:hypothetical protein